MTNQDYRDLNRGVRWSVGTVIWVIIAFLVVGAIIWGATVALSGIKGQGDAVIEKNSSENWVAAQERFEEMYAEVIASDRTINQAAVALERDPEDKTAQQNYDGATQHCFNAVADYNAEARKFRAEDFRSADLPDQISDIDPDTDCKENN